MGKGFWECEITSVHEERSWDRVSRSLATGLQQVDHDDISYTPVVFMAKGLPKPQRYVK